MTNKNYTNITISPLPQREVEIIGTITAEKMAIVREKAIAKFKKDIEIDGFRKGNAPESMIVARVGEMRLMEESAEIALSEEYPNILDEYNVDAIGRPQITITKIAPNNPLEFKIKTALMPEVKLADYKKLAKKENDEKIKTPEVEGVKKNETADEKLKNIKKKDKKRTEILETIMNESKIDLPKIIIDGEMEKMLMQFKDDIARSGISYEEYLKHIKKTEDDLKKEWQETALKRAKSQIILNTIAKEENIAPNEEDVKKEMEHILSHHKDADRFRVRMYVETFITNELVFQFLENQK